MTTTDIPIPDFVTIVKPRPIRDLVDLVMQMFIEDYALPGPRYVTVSESAQEAEFQFGNTPDTFHTLARWADRFGGTIVGEPGTDSDGSARVRCEVTFTFKGLRVRAYAYIKAAPVTT